VEALCGEAFETGRLGNDGVEDDELGIGAVGSEWGVCKLNELYSKRGREVILV
jgi:hypothetical protein